MPKRTAGRYLIPLGTSVVIVLFAFGLVDWIASGYRRSEYRAVSG